MRPTPFPRDPPAMRPTPFPRDPPAMRPTPVPHREPAQRRRFTWRCGRRPFSVTRRRCGRFLFPVGSRPQHRRFKGVAPSVDGSWKSVQAWLYILLHSMQVSSSFVVVCGRTLQKAFSKSVKAGGLEDEGWPCMAPEGEEAEESACWQSCSSSHTEKPSVRCSTALSSLSLKLQPWGGSACSSTCLRKPTSGRPTVVSSVCLSPSSSMASTWLSSTTEGCRAPATCRRDPRMCSASAFPLEASMAPLNR
ncbi:hypothetical protein EYF80_006804 [Liparis tanakae]|uniref:Uncharacterized protein n=1 Tax=Liparis tanakae TaxID=230148 RepID=A0A4Z2IYK5_9TELE|nr:hypothetical protein EYF80_006804 [Liparis tanakae]